MEEEGESKERRRQAQVKIEESRKPEKRVVMETNGPYCILTPLLPLNWMLGLLLVEYCIKEEKRERKKLHLVTIVDHACGFPPDFKQNEKNSCCIATINLWFSSMYCFTAISNAVYSFFS